MEELEQELKELLIKLELTHSKFYGKISINMQAGNIIGYDRRETFDKFTPKRKLS